MWQKNQRTAARSWERLVMEMNKILCLLALLTPSGSGVSLRGRFANPPGMLTLQGRLFINGPANYSRADRGVPTSFKDRFEWRSLQRNMTNDWIMRRNFSESFTVDKGSCSGSFRGTQTTCHRNETPAGTKIDCYLDAVIFRDEVMIYIGYVMHGGADVMLSFRNRMNFRRINHHTGSKSRDSMQILSLGGLLPRNEYMDFTFYIQSSNSSCYMDEDGIVLLAYQARYSPRGCRVY